VKKKNGRKKNDMRSGPRDCRVQSVRAREQMPSLLLSLRAWPYKTRQANPIPSLPSHTNDKFSSLLSQHTHAPTSGRSSINSTIIMSSEEIIVRSLTLFVPAPTFSVDR
jgi:hypothetical protein